MLETNQIYNVDCVLGLQSLDDETVDLTVTSPPYDNLRSYKGFAWDFEATANELYRVTKPGGGIIWIVGDATISGNETGSSFRQALYFKDIGFNLLDTMIYEKNGTGACGSNNCYWQSFEYMFVFTKGKIKTVHRLTNGKPRSKGGVALGRTTKDGVQKVETRSSEEGKLQIRTNIWRYNVGFANRDDKTGHPAVFPEQLVEDHILSWSNEGDVILDPFMGSGTTAKMALLNHRQFIGFEISADYCKIANDRIEKVMKEG